MAFFSAMPAKKRPLSKARKHIRNVLQPLIRIKPMEAGDTQYLFFTNFNQALFDAPGTWVWRVIATMLSDSNPRRFRQALNDAFEASEAGLTAEQEQGVQALFAQYEEWLAEGVRHRQRAEEQKRLRAEELEVAAEAKHKEDCEALVRLATERFSAGDVNLKEFTEIVVAYNRLFGINLTLTRATKIGLQPANRASLEAEMQAAKDEAKRVSELRMAAAEAAMAAAVAKADWERSLIFSTAVPAYLAITQAEYKRWLADGRLKVAKFRDFKKWGQHLRTPLFDPVFLATLTPSVIDGWRAEFAAASKIKRSTVAKKVAAKVQKTLAVKKDLDLEDFSNHFVTARAIRRYFTLCIGPTNSGKTHHAMTALTAAKTGVYLAPLRLLALENYERLKASGIAVNLLTGEERIIDPQATHVCATIEMCDLATPVEVAVVDEVQMLADQQRGWAWTNALLGVPAQRVYACGASYAASAVKELLADTGDECTVLEFERLAPLKTESRAIELHQVQPGDAVIAFSRREVLNFTALLKQRGLAVSVLYGALSPEVRRRQAQAFIEGKTQVVAATDCIGQGLNLPISRIVFSSAQKYDGVRQRTLHPHEAQQIAGRAGRYGLSTEGRVTAFGANDLRTIDNALSSGVGEIKPPFAVMPTSLHLSKLLGHISNPQDVREALELFQRLNFKGNYRQADLTDAIGRLAGVRFCKLSVEDQFSIATAPADPKHYGDCEQLARMAKVLSQPATVLSAPSCPFSLAKPGAHMLEQAEAHSRKLALYAWFGNKYPEKAVMEGLSQHREDLAKFIDKSLLDHKKTFFAKRKRQYHWHDEFDDFDDDDDF